MSEEMTKNEAEFSILNLFGQDYESDEAEAFYTDLNLLAVIDRLTGKWGRGIRRYFMYLPDDPREEEYRRAVYGDVRKEPVYRALMRYSERLAEVAELRGERETVSNPVQKTVWKIRETSVYCDAHEELAKELAGAELASEGMTEYRRILGEILESKEYLKLRKRTNEILEEIRRTRFVITYERDRIRVEAREIAGDGEYDKWLSSIGADANAKLVNPFIADSAITELEYACLEVLKRKRPELFRRLNEAAKRDEEYERPVLARFAREIPFYLSYAGLQREMEEAGYAFATPTTDGARMEATGLYDLALALTAVSDGREVVSNDFRCEDGDRFFVLTGPNQGGKTTFARSLGQLVYFTKMGLDVPAQSANVPFFPCIQTHFSVEESVETGRGKLLDELVRLAPMMETNRKGSFVVINELFTTAANYDAQIMGKRVLEHFIGLGCKGIYVTHIKELSEGCEGAVSLRAMLDERGVPTFEIRRGAAEDTPSAVNQVNKYRLSYSQLKERL